MGLTIEVENSHSWTYYCEKMKHKAHKVNTNKYLSSYTTIWYKFQE